MTILSPGIVPAAPFNNLLISIHTVNPIGLSLGCVFRNKRPHHTLSHFLDKLLLLLKIMSQLGPSFFLSFHRQASNASSGILITI